MENNFENELTRVLNEEKEIPAVVRESLDNTYNLIRSQPKKKWKASLRRGMIAACCLIAVGTMFTNKSFADSIKAFFNFNDKAIERAVDEGFTQVGSSSAADRNITIALDSYFCDSNKIGLGFKLKFNDAKLLEGNIDSIDLSYSIKNGNGEYVFDTDGKNRYTSNSMRPKPVLDLKNSEVQYDMLIESVDGTIPKLQNAVIEVKSVSITYENAADKEKVIEGAWNLPLNDENLEKNMEVEYAAQNNNSKIEVISAKVSPTAFNISFVLKAAFKDKSSIILKDMKLIDEQGTQYNFKGYSMEEKDGKIIITASFPVSSYENSGKYKLLIPDIGETGNDGKFVSVMAGAEADLIKK